MEIRKVIPLLIYILIALLIYWKWVLVLPSGILKYFNYNYLILQYRLGPTVFSFLFNVFYPYNIGGLFSGLLGLPPYFAIIISDWAFTFLGGFSMYLFLAKLLHLLSSNNRRANYSLAEGSSIIGGLTYMLLPYSLSGDDWTFMARMLFPLSLYILLMSLKDSKWFLSLAALVLWATSFYIDPRFGLYTFIFSIFIIFIPFYIFNLIEKRILFRKFILFIGSYSVILISFFGAYFSTYFWRNLPIPTAPSGQATDLIGIFQLSSPSILQGFGDGLTTPNKWPIIIALFPFMLIALTTLIKHKSNVYWKFLEYILALFSAICGLFILLPYFKLPLIDYFFLFLVNHNIVSSIFVVLFQFDRFVYSAITLLLSVGVGVALFVAGKSIKKKYTASLSATVIIIIISLPVLGSYYQSPGPFVPNNTSESLSYMKLYALLGPSFPYNSLVIPPYSKVDVYTYNSPYHETGETLYYYYYSYIVYLLNRGDVSQAVRLLDIWGIHYLIVDNSLLPYQGIPLHFSFTGNQLRNELLSSGFKLIENIGNLSVFNISETSYPFYASPFPLYVLGGLSDYGSLTNFLYSTGISVMPAPIFYDGPSALSQPYLPLNLSFPLLVSPVYTQNDLAVSLMLSNSTIVVPSSFLRVDNYWAAGYDSDPPQGLFVAYMAYGEPNYNWNYGYLPQYGYTFSQPDETSQPLSMNTSISHAGSYLVALNVLRSPSSGLLSVSIDNKNFSLNTKTDFNATYFSWMIVGPIQLKPGKVSLSLYAKGFVAVNIIALLPQEEFRLALLKAESYISKTKLIYLIPSTELPANHSLTFVPPFTAEYHLYAYPSNSTKVSIGISASNITQIKTINSSLLLVGGLTYTLSVDSNNSIVMISNFNFLDYFRDAKITVNSSSDNYEISTSNNYLVFSNNNLYPTSESLRINSSAKIYNIPIMNIFNGYIIYANQSYIKVTYAYSSFHIPISENAVPMGIIILLIIFCWVNLLRRRISNFANVL